MAKAKNVKVDEIKGSLTNSVDFLSSLKSDITKKGMKFSKYDNISIRKSTSLDVIDALLAANPEERGFQLRTFNLLYGGTGAGKSTILTQMANSFIKNTECGCIVYYDSEHTMIANRFDKLNVDPDRLLYICQDTSVENYHKLILSLADMRARQIDEKGEDYVMENPIIVIVDSFSFIYSDTEVQHGTSVASATGNLAKIYSTILKQHIDICMKYNITILGIIQHRDNVAIGPTPSPKDMLYQKANVKFSGGKAIQYAAFYFASLTSKKDMDDVYGDKAVEVEFKMLKSKSSVANKPVSLIFFPLTGYSNFHTNLKLLMDNNIIKAAGSYKRLDGYEKSFYASEAKKLYDTDPVFKECFDKAAKTFFEDFIDKVPKSKGLEDGSEVDLIGDDDINAVDPLTGELL